MKRLATVVVLLCALLACQPDSRSPRGVAEQFIDQYYVQINLAGAQLFCTGLAREKIEEQVRLTQGQPIDESTRKPWVRYKLLETREETADHASYLFEGMVHVAGADGLTPKWLVSLRRDGDAWKVSNFTEIP